MLNLHDVNIFRKSPMMSKSRYLKSHIRINAIVSKLFNMITFHQQLKFKKWMDKELAPYGIRHCSQHG